MDRKKCDLCPRQCGINRRERAGVCSVKGAGAYVSRAALHFWEEPCISGARGSGTVFFCGCNLHCIYCQNREISYGKGGMELDSAQLARVFLSLQDKGAHNINLVTPTQDADIIKDALILAKNNGLSIPIVYNCGGYEEVSVLETLDGIVDIYLTDFKYMDPVLAGDLSHAPDYPEKTKEALAEMVRQCPECIYDEDGMMKKGVIVRHLLLPGHVKEARTVTEYLYRTWGDRICISLMNQYTPMGTFEKFPYLNRKVTKREYERLLRYVMELGASSVFIQESGTAEESFIPAFDLEGLEFLL